MKAPTRGSLRRATNVSLDQGLAQEITATREARWREENAEAIKSCNSYVEKHGLPLAKYRRF